VEQFSKLLGQIYDAATDGRRWPAVLLEIATFAGATFAALSMEDMLNPLTTVLHLSSQDPDWSRLCQEAVLLAAPVGSMISAVGTTGQTFVSGSGLTETSAMETGRRAVSMTLTILEKTKSSLAYLSLGRTGAQPDDEATMQRNLELLAPHMRRAIAISQSITLERQKNTILTETLNHLSCAVFLLDQRAAIIHANDQASALLRERRVLSGNSGQLFLHEPQARAALTQALEVCDNRQGDVFIVGAHQETALLGQVTSLVTMSTGACAAFFVRPIRFDLPTEAARTALATAYTLTRREIGVLTMVVQAGSAPDAARALDLTPETVKAHLKSIFRKTGTHNQVDLVKLVASVTTLLR
jgi:DNA-binding CsgD family transcriptional regulator/PAS domain-containing protein